MKFCEIAHMTCTCYKDVKKKIVLAKESSTNPPVLVSTHVIFESEHGHQAQSAYPTVTMRLRKNQGNIAAAVGHFL